MKQLVRRSLKRTRCDLWEALKMEPQMRRHIKTMINVGISDEGLQKLHKVIEVLGPFVKSKEDMMFGYMIAVVRSAMINYTTKVYNRAPTGAEQDEVWNMLLKRASEIRTRITREFRR